MFGNANRFGTTNTQATPSFGSGFGQNQGSNQSVAFGTQANKTGFGFGNQPSAFGSINQTSAGSPFGGAISSFGTTTPSSGIGFGTANSTALGGSTPFRSSPAFGNSTSTFGNTTTAFGATVPSFGTSTTTFGNSTAAPTFGNTSTSFGNPTPAFGGSAPTFGGSAPIFGAAPSAGFGGATTAFGNPTSVGFGGNSQFGNNASFGNTSTFGGNTGTFGSSATTPAFGSVTAPTFGNTSTGFGSTTSTFGGIGGTGSNTSNTFRTPSFGTTGTSTFGSVAPSFGGSSMTTAPIFGSATAPTFGGSNLGSSTQSMFGSATTGFGAPTTSFGVPSTGFGNVGLSNQSGTSNIPFSPNMIKDTVTKGGAQSTTTSKLQCISGMPQYESKSLEELRWEDYQKGNKTSSLGSFGTTSAFGVTSSPFGTTNSGFGTSAFGNPTTSFGTGLNNSFTNTTFGNTTNSSIGAQSTGFNAGVSNPFGGVATNNSWSNPTATSAAKPTSFGGFGTTSPSTNTFGFTSNSSTLGTSTNLFGNSLGNSTTNAFGSSLGTTLGQPSFGQSMQQPQQSTFGNLTNTFGQQHNQQSNPFGLSNSTFGTNTFGGLGAKPEQSTFGTLGFPSATTTSGSTFGGLGSNPLSGFQNFGSNSFTPANQFGLGSSSLVPTNNFGSNLMPGFNTSAFGNTATSTSSGFGSISNLSNNNNQIQISSNLNNQNTNIPQQIDVAQKIEFLKKKRDEIDLQFKNLTEKKAVDMPSVIFPPSHIISKPLVARSPNSIVKIRPRGQRRETAHSNVNMRSPEKTIGIIHTKPSKRLVITELPRKIPVSDSKSYDLRMETPARPSEKSNDYLSVGDKTGLTPFTTDSPSIPYNLHSSQIQSENRDIPEDTSFSNLSGPPRLDNKDYFTVPDIKVLEKMSDLELYRIKNFTVCRPNVGQVLWEGETDVRGLHLDKIVFIEYKEVRVYEDNTAEFEKPSLGKGLNKPAIITLYNVFPSNSNKKDNYIDKLKAFCEENDAEFIEYVSETGEWTFRVKHFSRYGLVDSDEDDENCEQIQNNSNNFDNGNQGKDTTMHDILQEKSKIKDLVIRSFDKEIERHRRGR